MKIAAVPLGVAVGIASAILWTICSVLIALAPGPSLAVSRDLFHIFFEGVALDVTWRSYFVGLCLWSVGSGFFAWLCARLYNRMQPRESPR